MSTPVPDTAAPPVPPTTAGCHDPVDVVVPTVGRPSLVALLERLARERATAEGARLLVTVVDDRPAADAAAGPLAVPDGMVVVSSGGRGPAVARNTGWRRGRAPWVVFLDDDVLPEIRWAAALVDDLARLGAPARARMLVSQGRVVVPLPEGRRPTDAERNVARLDGARWITADLAVSRWLLSLVGGFDEAFPRAYREDTAFALTARRGGAELRPGRRTARHPVRPAPWYDSVRRQAGNADDARMAVRYGRRWRAEAGVPPGRFRGHVVTTAVLGVAAFAAATGQRRTAALAASGWLAATGGFTWSRVAPGPRTAGEWATMAVTSAAIAPAAVAWRAGGAVAARRQRPVAPAAVLFDRDGTLVEDVPYNGDPAKVRLRPGAAEAVAVLRRANIPIGLVSNQSGVARGLLDAGDVAAVNRRLEELVGPFDVIEVCPHADDDGCDCRKPAPGLVSAAASRLGVDPTRCWVIGDIAADVQAAHHAGARAVLVPTAATRPEEVSLAPTVAIDLAAAAAVAMGGGR